MSIRSATAVDKYVGARLRRQRESKGLSQTDLGKKLGVTFQQVQKYELAINRLSASRLYEISKILETSVGYFFDGYGKRSG